MNTLKDNIQVLVERAVHKALHDEEILLPDGFQVKVEYPKHAGHGDYAAPVALELARMIKDNPMNIAQKIADRIDNRAGVFSKVEIARPGFLNFFLSPEFMQDQMHSIMSDGDRYGHSETSHETKILLEFVSANPTGPLNIVSARAAAVGDTMANLFGAIGCQVNKEYYVNDFGNQARADDGHLRTRCQQAHQFLCVMNA